MGDGEEPERSRDLCVGTAEETVSELRKKLLEVVGLSEIFKVLGNETRTKIICLLAQAEFCCCDLASILQMSEPAVAYHLRLLKQMRLVRYHRKGKHVYYALDDEHILHLIEHAQQHFEEAL